MRVADYIIGFLEEGGCDAVFLVAGGFAMHMNDALARSRKLRYFCNHHEQASAMAADGYARRSGKLGVVMATGGPAATNLVTGIAEAWVDSIPLLFLTGTNARAQTICGSGIPELRQFGFLEIDIIPIVQSITKYSVSVHDPQSIRYHLERALHLATSGRPGPVLIEVPLDVQGAAVKPEDLLEYLPEPKLTTGSDVTTNAIRIAGLLKTAHKPLILAGHGIRCSHGEAVFQSLVSQLGVPVVTTQLAKDILPYEHPLFTGHPGMRGDRAGNWAVQNCDLLLSVGSSLHNQTTGYDLSRFAPKATRIQVDTDHANLARAKGIELQFRADCAEMIAALESVAHERPLDSHEPWWRECCVKNRSYRTEEEPHFLEPPDGPASLYEVVWEVNRRAPTNATFLTDSGQAKMIVGQSLQLGADQRYLANGGLGGMGWALPAAIGAALADPEIMIVAFIGDGSLQTNVHELQTLSYLNLNVKVIVIENGGYASIRATQNQYFGGVAIGADSSSGVPLPPTNAIAATYAISYVHSPDRNSLASALQSAFDTPGPVICAVETQREQKIVPYVASQKLPDGSMSSGSLDDMAPAWSV